MNDEARQRALRSVPADMLAASVPPEVIEEALRIALNLGPDEGFSRVGIPSVEEIQEAWSLQRIGEPDRDEFMASVVWSGRELRARKRISTRYLFTISESDISRVRLSLAYTLRRKILKCAKESALECEPQDWKPES